MKHQVGLSPNPERDDTVVAEGYDKPVKDFIAYTRNDGPEKDIEQLVDAIERLSVFEASRRQMAEYIQQLEYENAQLKGAITGLEADNADWQARYTGYVDRTEAIHRQATLLEEGLAFYADPKHWQWHFVQHPMLQDNGDTARRILAQFRQHGMGELASRTVPVASQNTAISQILGFSH